MFLEKNVTLLKEIDNVLYEALPKTRFDQVYDNDDYTLTEVIADIKKSLGTMAPSEALEEVQQALTTLMEEVPEEFNTLKKIADYINLENPESPIAKELDNTVSKDDISEDLLEKLKGIYSKTEIDEMFSNLRTDIDNRFATMIQVTNTTTAPTDLPENGLWFQVINQAVEG